MDEKGNNIAFRKNLLIIGIDLITNSENMEVARILLSELKNYM